MPVAVKSSIAAIASTQSFEKELDSQYNPNIEDMEFGSCRRKTAAFTAAAYAYPKP
jgi:hypothetical protein